MAIDPNFIRRLARDCPAIRVVQDEVQFLDVPEVIEASYRAGFADALELFGIYKNGVQHIGCMETPIKQLIDEYRDKPVPFF